MRLKTIKLTNFRGYRNTTEIPVDAAMTGIVGRNDFGKSTILEALAIFFEVDGIKADKHDMNCFSMEGGETHFEISCEFDDLPSFILIDEQVETTLAAEHLLNSQGNFEIVKTFKATTTGKPDKTYIRCQHPMDEPLKSLLGMKISELKLVGKDIEQNVEDKRIASLWRQAIRDAASPYECTEILLDVDKGLGTETKSIWGKILEQLPTFALFKVDRESSDGDSEAKNPLQQAVKDAQAALQVKISALEKEIQNGVLDVAERTLDKLREMAPELANELTPRFKEKPKWTFNFTLDGENGIPINKRGSGVRRLILLNFFRAEAEKTVAGTQRNVIYAIEEPETSQHPNYQIMLMKALLSLANQPNRQIILTTHVPALAGLIPCDGVRYVTKDENGRPVVKTSNDAVLREATESLGVLPETGMERAKGIVLVEGKSDVTFLRHAGKCLKESGKLPVSLEDVNIVPILIGGCGSVKHWVTLNLANDLGLPWCVFLDSDSGGDPAQVLSIQKRQKEVEEAGKKFFATRKREIENYLCPDLIKDETGIQVVFTDNCDAKKIIGKATGIKPNDVLDKFWPLMTAEKIIKCSTYNDGENNRIEIIEVLEGIISLRD
ncbi:AAA family ATPase [Xenorhabdus cabanillasii]|uniref:Predicted ATP-dependent endonuclease of the OLD family n=1 Tax=Xenorhabdus cabanillasii JM26 TaxID=1427517 RepID=W1JBN2_9GAMM|nr:AAA family ATPase [Xenorhabdus cabanillasii]PHM76625.1 ATP-dependent OLD family endonuclease [Xenorhabdus cabanillasii JM26]CDL87448.1 Predicted ATP-dependent endonuclease of the OLD family [Xenorhabdus cabanillasii JM26]